MKYVLIILAMLLTSCGSVDDVGTCIFEGCEQVSVPKDGDNGKDGANGVNGTNGLAGLSGSTGPKGDTGAIGPMGPQGPVGAKGDTGETGLPGISCEVSQVFGGALIECPTTSVLLRDGKDGEDAVVEILDPCGEPATNKPMNEILLRLATGEVVAWYQNVGFVTLVPGVQYVTTDPQQCRFKVTEDGEVIL